MVVNINEIEHVCNQFFAGLTPSSLVQSTNYQLEAFLNDPLCPSSSLQLIKRANSQYSIYFGALGLARSYSKPNLSLTQSTVLDHKQQLLKFLFDQQLPITILTTICKVLISIFVN
ncbi:hypothetical protein GJ496_011349 [Pomphorhynchus laevis]|nr:hypothetical protein GJ496_011349 [Pomphorhynchus laevis]